MSKSQEQLVAKVHTQREINGGCHCQAVKFSATVAADTTVLHCNCSICSMSGFQHLIVKHKNFKLLSGNKELRTYQFNTGQAKHLFCGICGVKAFYQPRSHADSWSINTHCIIDFKAAEWDHQDFDGQNWQQAHRKL